MNFLIRGALNIIGVYCFYLLNEVLWYPNFFIAIGFVITGIYCFKKANDDTFSSEPNKEKILPDKNLKKIESGNKYRDNVNNTFASTFRKLDRYLYDALSLKGFVILMIILIWFYQIMRHFLINP
ncbi:MAG: hypothetical protein CMO46_06475 [Verrucomicrobiales bacterium]|nr:hypothetical protein [Verrucomicrobiales bacterium]|tara:strand:+ start:6662 stop:7036 length:375 start_codon:yes stop_codon:yes gene_type:complete